MDPAAAVEGLLLPIGEFKGASQAMLMAVLSSLRAAAQGRKVPLPLWLA